MKRKVEEKVEKESNLLTTVGVGVGAAVLGWIGSTAADKKWGVNDKIKAPKKKEKKEKKES